MATVGDIIDEIRIELDDTAESRFSDATLLSIVKKALRRANRVIQRNALHFGKKRAALSTTANQAYVDLPADFDTPVPRGLWRTDTKEEVVMLKDNEWESVSADESKVVYARIDSENSRIELKNTPTSVVSLNFYYFPTISTASYTTGTTMPWSGRLDDAVIEYSTLRARNIDEQDISVDTQLLTDFENQIIQTYMPLTPTMVLPAGPMEGLS